MSLFRRQNSDDLLFTCFLPICIVQSVLFFDRTGLRSLAGDGQAVYVLKAHAKALRRKGLTGASVLSSFASLREPFQSEI